LSPYYQKTSFRFPFKGIVRFLIILNCAIYLFLILAKNYFPEIFGFIANHLFLIPASVFSGEIHQLATYMFFHDPDNILHIALNMFVLWMFGGIVENRLQKKLFVYYYLICGISGAILHTTGAVILPSFFGGSAVGASGAILGILVAFVLLYPDVPLYLFFMLPLKGYHIIIFCLTVDFIYFISGENIAILAHLGGMLGGYIMLRGLYKPSLLKQFLRRKMRKLKII
jgi:membrane associated rhomboid family serine protease